ncbi:MAG: hypothetical protein ACD_52C00303G0003 [uncultured bacterium]|uniref:DUF4446 domain-containing protein n=4 Tax=Candidatus Collieribacteriota TaxID=1752725 RepID=A0A0G1HHM9_9BACT|nr:MAG: hypothetical protein ACD_52C00303G0003 [uncultured bacterium]KKT35948.1 MAG: hypothetical protein UW23_C0009G0036 [Candidatus Collierbacteria bacterium GW2011_GWA1_44_12]KKT38806.1 MAG: hypothetical protein UW26_C0012G0021 [Candidatus Collierbacteria bacterium GW2011_GWF1_44_12]KKT46420.1 MAG: hypothetical protein UW35_C0014G0003 [Candidatus Collierbacteria bacterium GW2011_GWF2_44_15]KKU30585.1 MAG: hypothetical protein UX41_C0001G0054 [Candidatus Collierbacteria bacterium GW2011_GWE1_
MLPIYYIASALGVWLLVVTILLIRALSHYRRLTADVSKKDLVSSLNHLISATDQNADDIKKLTEKVALEAQEGKKHFQRYGFLRFNPFTDTGGDQSFALSLLDEKGEGFVISSLHSRENTRLYAKKIEDGKPVNNIVLSKEEQEVIKQALK